MLLLIDFCTPPLAWNLMTGLQFLVLHHHHHDQDNHHHHHHHNRDNHHHHPHHQDNHHHYHHHQPDVRVADQGGSNPARLCPRRSSTPRSTKGESVVRVVEVLGYFWIFYSRPRFFLILLITLTTLTTITILTILTPLNH